MISVYLMGGLSNCMFEISAIYSLAKENNDEFKIDYNYGLFTQQPATNYKGIVINIPDFNVNTVNFSHYNEPSFSYNQLPYTPNTMYKGYFQSEKYFIKYKDEIINMFSNQDILTELKNKYGDRLKNSVSLHFRRGDYLHLQHFHPCPSINYYKNSLSHIESLKKTDNIFVFSDDINWCRNNFKDDRCIYIEGQKDYEDLYLMSLCENNVIANSSFSWWGSYLNLNGDKIVCAPNLWFGHAFHDNWQDIYTEKMVKL